ncbi:hypothetical protein GCWU000282_01811 [Catonella morbi ATCC 51271]|uniref:Uncharacterized protein n=1 Tax=Catonella morbi ATCC 51271 TaxID=592026 RepID=V2Z7M6_9FIRM|nr:hypothetical protein [Catonella morbi]ESL02940.1 hypothetical protein GCWU000282_01811 [Catonella morbi ATCC 51271]
MSKRTNAMLDIKKGKNLERSLSAFAEELSAVYGSSAILNLSMNYANYFVNSKEKETDRSFAGLGDKINALIKSTIVEGNVSKKSIEEIESIREEVKARVDAATAFLSAFENFNYVLSRKLPNKEYDGKEFDTDDESRKILAYIFEDDDNILINSKIQRVISELPIRYTKGKFFDIIESSVDRYAGAEKKALKAFAYMVRQAGMIYDLDNMQKLYPELADEFEYFKNFEFDKATKKQILTESVKLNSTIARCSELTDDGILVMEVVNDLYAVLINWDSINKEDAELETEMITFTNESFANEDRSLEEFEAKVVEIFTKLEGKLEAVYEDLMSYEGTLFDVQSRFVKEASEYGYKDKYDDLYKCSILKQGSLFADLNDLEDTGLTETADLDKLKDTLKSEFDRIFNEVDRSVRRGIMAQVIGSIPVYFENRTEVMDYIRSSLASCNSREELVGTIHAVTEIICE